MQLLIFFKANLGVSCKQFFQLILRFTRSIILEIEMWFEHEHVDRQHPTHASVKGYDTGNKPC